MSDTSTINLDVAIGARGKDFARTAAVASTLLALFLAAADSTIVGSLLPTIAQQTGDPSLYPWLISAFLVTSIVSAPIAGSFADRFGAREVMAIALSFFAAASVGVALASNMPLLIGARALQGLGAGAIVALAYMLVGQIFGPVGRAKMQGLLSSIWGVAAVLGPLLGTLSEATVGWRWIFILNLPLAGVAATLILRNGPRATPVGDPRRTPNPAAVAAFTATLVSLLLLVMGPSLNTGGSVLAGLAFVVVAGIGTQAMLERRTPDSGLLPQAFITAREQRVAALLTIAAATVLYASVVLLPLALVAANASLRTSSGLVVIAGSLGWVAGSALCSGFLTKLGTRRTAMIGGALLAIGPLVIASHTTVGILAAVSGQLLAGLGTGLVTATTLVYVQNTSPPNRLGAYTAAITLCRNLGAAIGVNVIASLQLATSKGLPGPDALVISFQLAFYALATIGLFAVFGSLQLTKGPSSRSEPHASSRHS